MKKLNTLALTLLITGAIDGIRNLPATALYTSIGFNRKHTTLGYERK